MNVGVTGHQKLGNESTVEWVKQQITHCIQSLIIKECYSSLAIGSDQLFAEIVVSFKIPLVGVIPCNNYIDTFKASCKSEYQSLYNKCDRIKLLNFEQPSEEAFLSAGKFVTESSDMIIAIWNGKPAEGIGGTADIVNYAKTKDKKVFHINPILKVAKMIS